MLILARLIAYLLAHNLRHGINSYQLIKIMISSTTHDKGQRKWAHDVM